MLRLATPLSQLKGIAPRFLKHLEQLKILTIQDLLWHFPNRYEDFSQIYQITDLEPGQTATIQGIIQKIDIRRSWHRRMVIVEAIIRDDSGSIRAVWFNQPYLLTVLRPGRLANFAGKVAVYKENELYLSHPVYEIVAKSETRHTGRLVPIYHETRGLTSKGIRFLIQPILKNLEQLIEWLPAEILKANDFPEINQALNDIHFPQTIEAALLAKKRFIFEDLFLLQLFNLRQKLKLAREKAPVVKTNIEHLKKIIAELPFELTFSQKRSLWEIIQDIEKPRPMNRLLQGDVGSGKTVVAALAALIAGQNGLQTSFMAPTEVLTRQHFETLKKLFRALNSIEQPVVGLLTANASKIIYENDLEADLTKTEFKRKIKNGEIKIIIGTHALIQKDVKFANLALVVVDEQHRFGVNQRAALIRGQTRTGTPTNAETELLYKELTYKIRGVAFAIKKNIGLRHKESVYQQAFQEEFKQAGLNFEKEKDIPVNYGGKKIGAYRPDFIIDNKIILELKAEPYIGRVHQNQLWSYLKGSSYKLALLINFSGADVKIKRLVFDTARYQRESASGPRESTALMPHFLSMSATPIPRTLMLTIFGDLDLSIIDELPRGRKSIITKIVAPTNRAKAYQFIREQIKKGKQAFVICPRIEPQTDADYAQTNAEIGRRKSAFSQRLSALEVKSVKEEYEKLSKKIFPDLKVAMLHGQLKAREKEKIMRDFAAGRTDILVSTSVVEVGVDVPNATIMLIEGSERFGLAQLYQFRGRVGRGQHQSFCFLFTDSNSKTIKERLKAIINAKNGFELAERDLKLRGPGEFIGQKQTGLPDIAMRGLQDAELIKVSRQSALQILQNDPELNKHPFLKEKLAGFSQKLHLE